MHPLGKRERRPRKLRGKKEKTKREEGRERAGSGQPAIILKKEDSSHQGRKKEAGISVARD
jgi:hypothetical protein